MDEWSIFVLVAKSVTAVTALLMVYLIWMVYHAPFVTRIAARIPTLANLYVVTAYVLLGLELSPLQSTVSDVGTPLAFVSMLVAVPLFFLVTFLLLRKKVLDVAQFRYVRWSRVLWGLQLIPSLQMTFFLYAWASGR